MRTATTGSVLLLSALILVSASCDSPSADGPDTSLAPASSADHENPAGPTTLPPSDDTSFIDDVLADGIVSSVEMEQAYRGFVDCLSSGGGSGRYAFDLAVSSGIVLEWGVVGDNPEGVLTDSVGNQCTGRFLAGVEATYSSTHPVDASGNEIVLQRTLSCVASAFPDRAKALDNDSTPEQLQEVIDQITGDPNVSTQDHVQMYDCTVYGSYSDWRSFGNG